MDAIRRTIGTTAPEVAHEYVIWVGPPDENWPLAYMTAKGVMFTPIGANVYIFTAASCDVATYRSLPGVRAIIERVSVEGAASATCISLTETTTMGTGTVKHIPTDEVVMCAARKDCICGSIMLTFVVCAFTSFLIIMLALSHGCRL